MNRNCFGEILCFCVFSKIDQLRCDSPDNEPNDTQVNVNTKVTSLGRPINSKPQKRWTRSDELLLEKSADSELFQNIPFADDAQLCDFPADSSNANECVKPKRRPQFTVTGNSMLTDPMSQGRPIPTVQIVENPVLTLLFCLLKIKNNQ